MTPSGIAPASTSRWTAVAECSATTSLRASEPEVCGIPATANDSLIVHGTPSSGGSSSRSRRAATQLVGGVGLGARLVEAGRDDRVDPRVARLDQRDVRVDDLARGQLAGADRGGELDRRALCQWSGPEAARGQPNPARDRLARGNGERRREIWAGTAHLRGHGTLGGPPPRAPDRDRGPAAARRGRRARARDGRARSSASGSPRRCPTPSFTTSATSASTSCSTASSRASRFRSSSPAAPRRGWGSARRSSTRSSRSRSPTGCAPTGSR